jgi:hypothetical protein
MMDIPRNIWFFSLSDFSQDVTPVLKSTIHSVLKAGLSGSDAPRNKKIFWYKMSRKPIL